MKMYGNVLLVSALAAFTGYTAAPASAGTTNASKAGLFVPPTSWQRGSTPNSAYALWDNSFTTVTTNNVLYNGSNLAAANVITAYPTTLTGWNLSDTNPAVVTSTQHIYGNGQANLALSMVVPNYGLGSAYTTTFRLQSDTSTLAPDPASFSVSSDGGSAVPVTPVVTSLGSTGLDNLYQFSLPGNASSYVLNFSTPASGANFQNTALNAVSIDTNAAVPEPASVAVLTSGLAAVLARRRGTARPTQL